MNAPVLVRLYEGEDACQVCDGYTGFWVDFLDGKLWRDCDDCLGTGHRDPAAEMARLREENAELRRRLPQLAPRASQVVVIPPGFQAPEVWPDAHDPPEPEERHAAEKELDLTEDGPPWWVLAEDGEATRRVVSPKGWWEATLRYDGCVQFRRYFNVPMAEEVDDIHLCDLDETIKRLEALRAFAFPEVEG